LIHRLLLSQAFAGRHFRNFEFFSGPDAATCWKENNQHEAPGHKFRNCSTRFHRSNDRYRSVLVDPESYPLDKKQRGQDQPQDQNNFDAYMANGVNVTVNARVAFQRATPVAEDLGAGEQIDDEKQRSGNSQCRNSGGIKSGEINSRLVKGGEASDQKWIVIVAKQLNDTAPNRL
jgi:hypothetical protein